MGKVGQATLEQGPWMRTTVVHDSAMFAMFAVSMLWAGPRSRPDFGHWHRSRLMQLQERVQGGSPAGTDQVILALEGRRYTGE